MNLLQYPLPRICLGMLAGCAIGSYLCSSQQVFGCFIFTVLINFIVLVFRLPKWVAGMAILTLACSLGIFSNWIHRESNYANHYLHYLHPDRVQQIEAVVREQLKTTSNYQRYVVHVTKLDQRPCRGKLLINCKSTTVHPVLPVGLPIQFEGIVQTNRKPLNPDSFDYSNYLNQKNICAQVWVSLYKLKKRNDFQRDIYYYADKLRSRIREHLDLSGCNPIAAAVFNALLLGQQQEIPTEITKDYQYAGVVHILSVSGLHVGFIIVMLRFLFRFFPQSRGMKITELLLSIMFLWAFAVIAGLAPSILRAVSMFSFVSIGLFLNRRSSNINALFVSAFLLLCVVPQAVFDIGFQLSYAALLFIFWLQPVLQKLYSPTSKIGLYIWENCTVSVAAQLGTLPISLYYFHQFPGLFLVANLLLLPLLTGIMSIGILSLVWLIVTVPPRFLINLLEWSIGLMNQFIHLLASFDSFVFEHIPCTFSMTVALYVVLFAGIYWLKNRQFLGLIYMGLAAIGLQLTVLFTLWGLRQEHEILVFHSPRYSALVERHGNFITAYTDLPLEKRKPLYSYATAHFCRQIQFKKIPQTGMVNSRFICVLEPKHVPNKIRAHSLLLLRQSPKINLDLLIQASRPKLIIADGSNYKSYIRRWKASCIQAKIPFHATGEKGFYTIR